MVLLYKMGQQQAQLQLITAMMDLLWLTNLAVSPGVCVHLMAHGQAQSQLVAVSL